MRNGSLKIGVVIAILIALVSGAGYTWCNYPSTAHVEAWLRSLPPHASARDAIDLLESHGFPPPNVSSTTISSVRNRLTLCSLFIETRTGVMLDLDPAGRVQSFKVQDVVIAP